MRILGLALTAAVIAWRASGFESPATPSAALAAFQHDQGLRDGWIYLTSGLTGTSKTTLA